MLGIAVDARFHGNEQDLRVKAFDHEIRCVRQNGVVMIDVQVRGRGAWFAHGKTHEPRVRIDALFIEHFLGKDLGLEQKGRVSRHFNFMIDTQIVKDSLGLAFAHGNDVNVVERLDQQLFGLGTVQRANADGVKHDGDAELPGPIYVTQDFFHHTVKKDAPAAQNEKVERSEE